MISMKKTWKNKRIKSSDSYVYAPYVPQNSNPSIILKDLKVRRFNIIDRSPIKNYLAERRLSGDGEMYTREL